MVASITRRFYLPAHPDVTVVDATIEHHYDQQVRRSLSGPDQLVTTGRRVTARFTIAAEGRAFDDIYDALQLNGAISLDMDGVRHVLLPQAITYGSRERVEVSAIVVDVERTAPVPDYVQYGSPATPPAPTPKRTTRALDLGDD